jgi:predicted transcriptional regulator of viral defense system
MVRRGLFVSTPNGVETQDFQVDHRLVAASLTADAVITHRSALEAHGLVEDAGEETYYSAVRPLPRISFSGRVYKGVKFPMSLVKRGLQRAWAAEKKIGDVVLPVSSLERTVVDVLARPDLSGGWTAAKKLLSSTADLDLDALIEYVEALNNATTAAKAGLYLSGRIKELGVTERHLEKLLALKPSRPHYLERSRRRDGRFIKEWNLLVDREDLEGL